MSENEAYKEVRPSTAASEATFMSSESVPKLSENPTHEELKSTSESPEVTFMNSGFIKLSENQAYKEVQSSSEALQSSVEYAYVKVDVGGGGGLQRSGDRTSRVEDNSHTSPDSKDFEASYEEVPLATR